MDTESVLKHLAWVGPLTVIVGVIALRRFRLFIERRKAAQAAGTPLPDPDPGTAAKVITYVASLMALPPAVRAQALKHLLRINPGLHAAVIDHLKALLDNDGISAPAKPKPPDFSDLLPPEPKPEILVAPASQTQRAENSCEFLNRAQQDMIEAEAKKVATQGRPAPEAVADLKTWAMGVARGEFLTTEKRAEIVAARYPGQSEEQAVAAWTHAVLCVAIGAYWDQALSVPITRVPTDEKQVCC